MDRTLYGSVITLVLPIVVSIVVAFISGWAAIELLIKEGDKFAVLSVYLDDTAAQDEVRTFRELKGVRDRLSHGEEVEEAALPTRDVQRLFDKYLRNHLRRDA